jgi:hypothetical protein
VPHYVPSRKTLPPVRHDDLVLQKRSRPQACKLIVLPDMETLFENLKDLLGVMGENW